MITMPEVNLEDLQISAAILTDLFTRVEALDKKEEPLALEDAWELYMEKKKLHRRLLFLYRKTRGNPPDEYTLKSLGDHISPSRVNEFTLWAAGILFLVLAGGGALLFQWYIQFTSEYAFSHPGPTSPIQPISTSRSALMWELGTDLVLVIALIRIFRRVAKIIFRARKQDRNFTKVELQVIFVSLISALFIIGVLGFSMLFTKEA
jgi:hypothetical protein